MSKDIHVREGPWLIVFGKGQEQGTRFGIFCLHGTHCSHPTGLNHMLLF